MHWYIPGTYTVELTDAFGSGDTHSVSKSVTVAGNGLAVMPTPRSDLAAGTVNGVIYAIGGSGTVEAFDPATNTWTTKAPMPTPRFGFAVAAANGMIYAVGGTIVENRGDRLTGTVEAYDPMTNTWTSKAPMPTPRQSLGVAQVNGVLYAIGGSGEIGNVEGTEAYDPVTNSWTTRAPMPWPRWRLAVAQVNGLIYAIGGRVWGGGRESDVGYVERYNPVTDTWR